MGLSGCAATSPASSNAENSGALESYNRTMFEFNRRLDKYLIRPAARGYRAVTNEFIRDRVSNFFKNVEEPVFAANHILQGEFASSGQNLGRFVINTTLGGVGLFDVASELGMEAKKTGFDETLASWCVPDGPFVVLPVMGPSTPRAATGFVVDGYASPLYWVANESNGEDAWLVYYGVVGLKYLNLVAQNLNLLESMEEGSIDYYESMKTMYLQNRGKIKVCGVKPADNASSYDFDMDDMEEFE